jgi:hypothetical protein
LQIGRHHTDQHRRTAKRPYAAIARKAGVCVRTVATALARLCELGIQPQ